MARSRRQLGFKFRTWGGVRSNAGRPPKGKVAGVSHLPRPVHSFRHPLHVTLRVGSGLPSLREPSVFSAVRRALAEGKQHFGFSLVQFSVQRDHLHLIAEANDRRALSRGMQGLSIRIARAVNAQLGRRGRLFADRYHARALTTPRTVRLTLRYVLLNARKHLRGPQGPEEPPIHFRPAPNAPASRRKSHLRGPQGPEEPPIHFRPAPNAPASRRKSLFRGPQGPEEAPSRNRSGVPAGFVDGCSSAPWFSGFDRAPELIFGAREAREDWQRASGGSEPPVVRANSWLLRIGWRRAGGFDIDETPG